MAALAGSLEKTTVATTQILSFNPDLDTYCQLMPLQVGKQICLSPNGGFPNVGATTGAQPSATPTALAPVPTPTVSGSTSSCGRWYQIQSGDICQTVVLSNSVALTDFLTLNPSEHAYFIDVRSCRSICVSELDANCTNLWLKYYYYVTPFSPFASVTASPVVTTNYSSATIVSYTIPTANYMPTTYLVALTTAGIAAPTNIVDGSRTVACGNYYNVQVG